MRTTSGFTFLLVMLSTACGGAGLPPVREVGSPDIYDARVSTACGGAGLPPVREVGSPDIYDARVSAARGPVVPRVGDRCTITVQHTTDRTFNCRIRIDCAGDQIYGLAEGGYNRCYEVDGEFVFARDRRGTRLDGDPRLHFDVNGGRIVVSDDAPDIELEISLHQTPAGYEQQPLVPEV